MNKQIYKDVWDMMYVCNSSGVVHSFSNKITPYVWEEVHSGEWTKGFNEHPLVIITADKILQLAKCFVVGSEDGKKISDAYSYVADIVYSK